MSTCLLSHLFYSDTFLHELALNMNIINILIISTVTFLLDHTTWVSIHSPRLIYCIVILGSLINALVISYTNIIYKVSAYTNSCKCSVCTRTR